MADKDDEFLDGDDAGADAGAKEGKPAGGSPFASAMLMQILKWAAIVVGFLILVVTVSVIVFSMMGGGAKANDASLTESPEYSTKPLDGDWYSNIEEIRGNTYDTASKAMYMVKLHIMYTKNDKELQGEIIARTIQIQDALMTWFSRQTSAYLSSIDNRDSVRETVRQLINKMLMRPILDIRFTKYEVLSL